MKPLSVPDIVVENFKKRVFSSSPYTVPAVEAQEKMQLEYRRLVDCSISFDGSYEPDPLDPDDEEEPGNNS